MIYPIIPLYKSRTIFFRSWKPHVDLVEKFIIFPYRYVPAWKFSLWKRWKLECFRRFLNTITIYVGEIIISTRVKWSYCTSVRRPLEYTNRKSTGQSHPYRENQQATGKAGRQWLWPFSYPTDRNQTKVSIHGSKTSFMHECASRGHL